MIDVFPIGLLLAHRERRKLGVDRTLPNQESEGATVPPSQKLSLLPTRFIPGSRELSVGAHSRFPKNPQDPISL